MVLNNKHYHKENNRILGWPKALVQSLPIRDVSTRQTLFPQQM